MGDEQVDSDSPAEAPGMSLEETGEDTVEDAGGDGSDSDAAGDQTEDEK